MDANPSITAALADLVDQSNGFAELYDPATKRTFYVTEQTEPHPRAMPATDEELRRQLEEANAQVERGEVCTLTTEEILAEARRRSGIR